jgi:hypothetical protein
MKQANLMAEDMFEKAREAFFGTVKMSPKPSASSPEFVEPRNELPQREATSSSSDEHEAAQTLVSILARA